MGIKMNPGMRKFIAMSGRIIRHSKLTSLFLGIMFTCQGIGNASTTTTFDVLEATGSFSSSGTASFLSTTTLGGPIFSSTASYAGITRNVWNVVSTFTFATTGAVYFTNLNSSYTYQVICNIVHQAGTAGQIYFNNDTGNKYYYYGLGMSADGASVNYNGIAQSNGCNYLAGGGEPAAGSLNSLNFTIPRQNDTAQVFIMGQAMTDAGPGPNYYSAFTSFGCYYAGTTPLSTITIKTRIGLIHGNCRILALTP